MRCCWWGDAGGGIAPLVHYGDNDLAALSARPETFGVGSKEEYDDGQDGKGSPELLAKRAEARRIREEASVAIEAELAKDEYC